MSCSILNYKLQYNAINTKVNPTLLVIPCKFFGRIIIYDVAVNVTYHVVFIQISIIHDNISSQVANKDYHEIGQWTISSIIHDIICSLIQKKCHPNLVTM
jgi:hypothetical protein